MTDVRYDPKEIEPRWQKLWADVADTLASAEGKTAPGRKPDLK